MTYILTVVIALSGNPVVGEFEGTFPGYTDRATACNVLVIEAAKQGAVLVVGCDLRIEV